MASTSASACSESFLLAAVSWMASGIPRESQIRWRLLPSLARSVGLGPVNCPQKQLGLNSCRLQPWTSRFESNERANRAAQNESNPKYQPAANHASVSSRSYRTRSPTPWAAFPKECHCGGQIQCPSGKRDQAHVAVRLSAWAEAVTKVAEPNPTSCYQPVGRPYD